MATIFSVNGEDGATLARSSGIRLVQGDSQALVLRNQELATRNGQPGRNAPQALRGGPGGTLAVQLSESNLSQGAIRVERVEYRSAQHPPQNAEVPVGRDLNLTAIGGTGESGHNGGDGQRGQDGVDGTGATKASDATNGTNGGRGGDAGRGSSGGDGGPGGAIHIIVHENNTHLLMAVSCDVRGGQGGIPGEHGEPGAGGSGGKGGQGWKWDEIVGYTPYCTDSCIKSTDHASNSTTLARMGTNLNAAGSHLNASSRALIARTGALTVSGNNLQNMIAQTAIRYNATRQPRRGEGYCKCGGGTGSCAGCGVKPVIKWFQRQPGLDGKEGEKGTSITTPLAAGQQGEGGTVSIAVISGDGSTQAYSAPWSLELVDFEVEDENGDGVFEPGEHVFIRRIKVRNVGGMPSPTCRIPVTLANDSEWFGSVPAHQGGLAYLPTSVPAGESASTEGSIKVRIKERTRGNSKPASLATRFLAKDTLNIRADMPWLDRRMPSFDFTKEIEISYPCGLGGFEFLSTIAQGAVSRVQYKVQNLSTCPLGERGATVPVRAVEVRATFPADYGRLIGEEEEEEGVEVIRAVPCTRPKDSLSLQQQFRILSSARSHTHFPITFELYLESPNQDATSETLETILVERHTVRLQVTNTYVHTPNAKVLLITNPKTTERQSQAIQHFIRNTLRMEMDLCNAHQNGGLLRSAEDVFAEPYPITAPYREKTIIVLDDTFEFFGTGDRTVSQLFDPRWLSEISRSGTSSSFIGCDHENAFDMIVRAAVLPLPLKLEEAVKQLKKARTFSSPHELVDSIKQEKQFGSARPELSAIPLKQQKWYRFGRDKSDKQAKALATALRNHLPNERFLVTCMGQKQRVPNRNSTSATDTSDEQMRSNDGLLVVLTGLDHHRPVWSTESSVSLMAVSDDSPNRARLDDFGKYNIISALPVHERISLLWKNPYSGNFIPEAMTLSVVRDLFQQMTGLMDSAYKRLVCLDENDIEAIQAFLKVHLPYLGHILNTPEAKQAVSAPEPVLEVLRWTLAFTASMKRHRRLDGLIRVIVKHRPSTRNLNVVALSFDSAMRPSNALIQRIAQLTRTPENYFTKGQRSASQVVPRTRHCTPREWDSLVRSAREWRDRVQDDMDYAQKELGRMLVDFTPPEAAELSTGQ